MKEMILITLLAVILPDCEGGKGQYRHNPQHHDKPVNQLILP